MEGIKRKRRKSGESPRKRKKMEDSAEETMETSTVTSDGEIEQRMEEKKRNRKRKRNKDRSRKASDTAEEVMEAATLSDSDHQPLPDKTAGLQTVEEEEGEMVDESSPSGDYPKKSGTPFSRIRCSSPFKPKGNSWLPHISNIVILRCLQLAAEERVDPRSSEEIDFEEWAQHLLRPEDVRLILLYTAKEFPQPMELSKVVDSLSPYRILKAQDVIEEDIKAKYKTMLPKPPVTAYFQFVNVKRKCLKEKHPELSGAELTTKLSKKWKSLPKEKQDKYRSLYQRMREDYLTELEEFYTQHPEAQPLKVSRKSKNKKRKHSDSEATRPVGEEDLEIPSEEETRLKELEGLLPKPPTTSYFQFYKAKRPVMMERHPDMTSTEVTKVLAQKWRKMSNRKKEKYKQLYLKEKDLYEDELAKFNAEHPDVQEKLKLLKNKRRGKSKDKKKPKNSGTTETPDLSAEEEKRIKELKQLLPKPPISSYFLFCKAKRPVVQKKHPQTTAQDVTKALAEKWHSMSDIKKEKYKQLHLKQKDMYKEELAKFNVEHPEAQELFKLLKKKRDRHSPAGKRPVLTSRKEIDTEDGAEEGDQEDEYETRETEEEDLNEEEEANASSELDEEST